MLFVQFVVTLALLCLLLETAVGFSLQPSVRGISALRKFKGGLTNVNARSTSTLKMESVIMDKVSLNGFGERCFRGQIAAPYLTRFGLKEDTLEKATWVHDNDQADRVAAAVLAWASDNGASSYCHWFQPLGSSGVRHGQSACVQNMMVEFGKDGRPQWDFKGKMLKQGETDGSSYPNGGLRATHRAGGYLAVDPTSPIFIREDTVYIPATFATFNGEALDEKTPLLRACDALSREGVRLLNLLGHKTDKLVMNIGLEQEFFLVPREAYLKRPDLQLSGRTVTGAFPARGQEMSDHYMAPPSLASKPIAAMKEIQKQCFKMGIPLRTRHREVAPNQYEFAPLFGVVNTQIDQNLMVMQIIEEVAAKYGLAALFQEKPFQGVNGSGKHNNWSVATGDGTNLFNVEQLAKNTGSYAIFPVIMAAIIKAYNEHGDLMRMAIATPGNDFRLGACEAPPAIMSMYLGEDMTNYLESYWKSGETKPYIPKTKTLDMGASAIAKIEVPAQDRNRSSPFPYGGHRFEFRALGSSQNASLVNTVLGTILAKAFKEFADAIEKGAKPADVAAQALKDNWKVIFNGNGYDPANQKMLTERGVCRIDSGVEAMSRFGEPQNVALFESMGVLSKAECESRQTIMLNHYVGQVEIEVLSMIEMMQKHIIPAAKESQNAYTDKLSSELTTLQNALHAIHHTDDAKERARLARTLRLETMINSRKVCDEVEALIPPHAWTLATYKELLFIDQH